MVKNFGEKCVLIASVIPTLCFLVEVFAYKYLNKYVKILVLNRAKYNRKFEALYREWKGCIPHVNGVTNYGCIRFVVMQIVTVLASVLGALNMYGVPFTYWLQLIISILIYVPILIERHGKSMNQKYFIFGMNNLFLAKPIIVYGYVVLEVILMFSLF